MTLTEKEEMARARTCLALDVSTTAQALSLAEELGKYVGMFKLGKELHTSAVRNGELIIDQIYETSGHRPIFLDLKFHDTPNTVYGASLACVDRRISMFNLHIAGGEEMCRKAVEAANRAHEMGVQRPKVIGVTVLTSLDDSDLAEQGLGISYDDLVRRRTELALKWELDGVVCPANKAGMMEKEFGSKLLYVTPGIEWAGVHREGQQQLYTPDLAVKDCSNSILVVGGAVTKRKTATERRNAAYEILQAMAAHL
jgi:orotidine-5'-phosphate decarboxylase